MKIVLAGGGGGGHLYSLLAVAEAVEGLGEDVEEVRVDELFFFGDVFQRLCNGNEGIKVSPAPPACKYNLHVSFS